MHSEAGDESELTCFEFSLENSGDDNTRTPGIVAKASVRTLPRSVGRGPFSRI